MTKAVITLKDTGGQIEMSLFLEGGFQKDSHAHQHANLVLKYLDSIAGMKTEGAVQWVEGEFQASKDAPPTERVENETVRGHLEEVKDALHGAMAYRSQNSKMWEAFHRAMVEIEKALTIPDEALAPVDMAHKIVGANGLALNSSNFGFMGEGNPR